MYIRSPIEWGWNQLKGAATAVEAVTGDEQTRQDALHPAHPAIRRIGIADLRDAVVRGRDDFAANRTDVIFLCVMYPVVGLILARLAFGYGVLPLLFPLAAGFTLVGPLAAVGLEEMSRRREQGAEVSWTDAFGVLGAPSFGAIFLLGVMLMAIFLLWLMAAAGIYAITLGPEPPASAGAFFHDVFATGAGWAMICVGMGVGFLFAVLVLSISVVSFPLMLDRHVTVETAVRTSIRAVATNPGPMAAWGLIVAVGLVLGSIPLLLGLAVVMPILGHATWHLYRKVVAPF